MSTLSCVSSGKVCEANGSANEGGGSVNRRKIFLKKLQKELDK